MASSGLIEHLLRGTESQDSSASEQKHLCLINLPIFPCDEEAGNEAPTHTTTLGYPEARKGCLFFFFLLLYTAELFPKGRAVV